LSASAAGTDAPASTSDPSGARAPDQPGAGASARPGLRSPQFRANLRRRVVTAFIALPALLAVVFVGPPLLGVTVLGLFLLLGLLEFYALLDARGLAPLRATGVVLLGVIFAEETHPATLAPPLWPLVALVLLAATLRRAGDLAQTVPAAAATLLGAIYLGALGGSMAGLLLIEPVWHGPWRLLLLMAIVMAADTAAFFVGHAFGRRRLAPALSPGKTVEGALGGLVGGVVGALLVRAYGLPWLELWIAVALGATVAALGTLGDLLESLLKRWAGVKDSGALFPGHGGVLDRLDSLLFGAPVLYYYFLLFPPG
jgi:phosphatidate cytidylyltransferase